MPGVKLITEQVEKEVTFMTDVDPEFVSLVKHGANRMPFRVVKKEKGGEANAMLTIQSILLPNGVEIADLAKRDGLGYLSEAKTAKAEKFQDYTRVDQAPVTKFEEKSLKMMSLGKGWILAGKLKDEKDADGLITLGAEEVKKLAEIPISPMDSVISNAPAQQAAIAVSFRDMFDRELYSMLDVVHGSLRQAAADPKKRKATIIGAVDAFKSFMSLSLDALGDLQVKLEKFEFKGDTQTTDEGGSEMTELFKSKEEFAAAVGEVVTPLLSALKDELKPKETPAGEGADGKKTDTTDGQDGKKPGEGADAKKTDGVDLSGVVKSIETLTASVAKIAKAQEDLGNQLSGEPGNGDGDDPGTPAKKEDGDGAGDGNGGGDDGKKPSVFAGLLTKKQK